MVSVCFRLAASAHYASSPLGHGHRIVCKAGKATSWEAPIVKITSDWLFWVRCANQLKAVALNHYLCTSECFAGPLFVGQVSVGHNPQLSVAGHVLFGIAEESQGKFVVSSFALMKWWISSKKKLA